MNKHQYRQLNEMLSGTAPAEPPWGQQWIEANPEIQRRVTPSDSVGDEVAIVLGAGGAFAPDLILALQHRGYGAVIGLDVQLTYPVPGVIYRSLDLRSPARVFGFFRFLKQVFATCALRPGPVFDLATIQTSPTGEQRRETLSDGKQALVEALCEFESDMRLVYMSTAEVYGAPVGAPYREDHPKTPINPYGRAKWQEERVIMAADRLKTATGILRITALRCWTICMVVSDAEGRILCARNYNDPTVAVAYELARAGVPVPLVDRTLQAQFHMSEEVAEVCVLLGSAPLNAHTWGRPFNCVGRSTTHGHFQSICEEVFEGAKQKRWWSPLVGIPLRGGQLPAPLLKRLASLMEFAGGMFGARDLAARLPFLYRSTHMTTDVLLGEIGDQLTVKGGSPSEWAARRLAVGIRNGGDDALNLRRYKQY